MSVSHNNALSYEVDVTYENIRNPSSSYDSFSTTLCCRLRRKGSMTEVSNTSQSSVHRLSATQGPSRGCAPSHLFNTCRQSCVGIQTLRYLIVSSRPSGPAVSEISSSAHGTLCGACGRCIFLLHIRFSWVFERSDCGTSCRHIHRVGRLWSVSCIRQFGDRTRAVSQRLSDLAFDI